MKHKTGQRLIHSSVCSSEKFGLISSDAERLYWRLYTHTDECGNIPSGAGFAKDQAFPKKANLNHLNNRITYGNVEVWLNELIVVNLIFPYWEAGSEFFHFTGFNKHQKFRNDKKRKLLILYPISTKYDDYRNLLPGQVQENGWSTPTILQPFSNHSPTILQTKERKDEKEENKKDEKESKEKEEERKGTQKKEEEKESQEKAEKNKEEKAEKIRKILYSYRSPLGFVAEKISTTTVSKNDFLKIWDKYPKRIDKKGAQRHFLASVKTTEDLTAIHLALENYITFIHQTETPIQFVKNGASWFNNWKDWQNSNKIEELAQRYQKKSNHAQNKNLEPMNAFLEGGID